MNRWILFFSLFLATGIIISCSTASSHSPADREEALNGLFSRLITPQGGAVLFGTTTRKADREEEYDECLTHCAEQASRHTAVQGEGVFVVEKRGNRIGYYDTFSMDYDRDLVSSLKDKLEVVSYHQDDRGSYMRAVLPSIQLPGIDPDLFRTGKRPSWLTSSPELPGYHSGVGVVRRSRHIPSSIERADLAALGDILSQLSVSIASVRGYASEDLGTAVDTRSRARVEGTLQGFLVIARWTEDGYYYSLAVCPDQGQEVE